MIFARRSPIIFSIMVFLLTSSLVLSSSAYALEVLKTKEGSFLVRKMADVSIPQTVSTPKRDPFSWAPELVRKYSKKKVEKVIDLFNTLKLSGIIWSEKMPLAVINNTLVSEGDSIENAEVRAIFNNEVLLERDNQHHSLQFKEFYELDDIVPSKRKVGNK